MHIPDNYLSPATCGTLLLAVAPIWTVSVLKVKAQIKTKRETIPMMGVTAALAFLIMMFNVPIPGGTTAHAVGGTLLAVLIGPWAACLSLSVTLLLQALLFGDGGVIAFGANVLNMAVIMPFVGYAFYRLGQKLGHERIGLAIGAYVGICTAALAAGVELGLQPLLFHTASGQPLYCPYGLNITIPAMLLAHVLVAGWVEAGFTLVVFHFVKQVMPQSLYQAPLTGTHKLGLRYWGYLLVGLACLSPLGLLAHGTAWGEWSTTELHQRIGLVPQGMHHGFNFKALFADYSLPGLPTAASYLLAAATVLLICLLVVRASQHEQKD